MAEETLDNIASSLTPTESDTQTETKTETTETAPTQTVENAAVTKREKTPKGYVPQKSFDEFRSHFDRTINEKVAQIQQLEKKLQGYAPIEPFLPQLQQALEEKRKAELQQQYQQNPLQTQQQLMEQMLNERLQPLQQQAAQQQNEQFVSQSINFMKQTYGDQAFNEVSPYMSQILDNTAKQYGQEVADLLVKAPEHLFTTAFGYLALQKIKEFNQNAKNGTAAKQQLAQTSAGISRPNKTAKTSVGQSTSDIEKAAYDFLAQNA